MTDEWHELAAGELPRLQLEKLPVYGFQHEGKSYLYEEVLLDGAFLLQVKVAASGKAATLLLDRESQEPYVLHLIESAAGAFVGSVKDAYRKALNRLGEACGEHGTFSGGYPFPSFPQMVCAVHGNPAGENRFGRTEAYSGYEPARNGRTGSGTGGWQQVLSWLSHESEVLVYPLSGWFCPHGGIAAEDCGKLSFVPAKEEKGMCS